MTGRRTDNQRVRVMILQVSEQAFIANEQRRLEDFAALIRDCGITLYELSRGSRVKYDTLLRALRLHPIRPENEERVRYYIRIKNEHGNQENQTDRP